MLLRRTVPLVTPSPQTCSQQYQRNPKQTDCQRCTIGYLPQRLFYNCTKRPSLRPRRIPFATPNEYRTFPGRQTCYTYTYHTKPTTTTLILTMRLSQYVTFGLAATSSVQAASIPEDNSALSLLARHGGSSPRSENILAPSNALAKRKGGGGKGGGGGKSNPI